MVGGGVPPGGIRVGGGFGFSKFFKGSSMAEIASAEMLGNDAWIIANPVSGGISLLATASMIACRPAI